MFNIQNMILCLARKLSTRFTNDYLDWSNIKRMPWYGAITKYQLYCEHSRWTPRILDKIMESDYKLATLIRDPAERFISHWSFVNSNERFNSTLSDLIQNDLL